MPVITNQLINDSKQLYQTCLALFPETHRRAYGRLMTQLFTDKLKQVQRRDSIFEFISLWLKTLTDIGANSVSEHFYEWRKTLMEFKNKFEFLVKFHVAELACGLLAVIISFLSFRYGMTVLMTTVASTTIVGTLVASLLDKAWRKQV